MRSRTVVGSALALVAVVVVTLFVRAFEARLAIAMLVLLSTVVGAALLGRIPGVVAAMAGAASLAGSYTDPVDGVDLSDGQDLAALVAFLVVAMVVGSLVAQVDEARDRARQREVDAELSRSRAAFFAAAGHNLRTPLATIHATTSALLDAGDQLGPADRDELLATIHAETDRLSRMVDKVLSMSRIRAGGLVPDLTPVDVAGIAQVTARRLRAVREDVAVRIDIPPDLGPLRLDVTMVEQLLLNLCENAVRHAPPGSEVLVAAEPVVGAVELRVVDHGPGIPPEDRVRVFDEYVRGDDQGDRQGTGLGLAIARALVQAQSGTIEVRETPGGGATMVVRFPVDGASPTPPGSSGADRSLQATGEGP